MEVAHHARKKLDEMHELVDKFYVLSIVSLSCYVFGLIWDLIFNRIVATYSPFAYMIGLAVSITWVVLVLKNKSRIKMILYLLDDEYYFTNQEYDEYNQIKSKYSTAGIIHKIAYIPLVILTWVLCAMIALILVVALLAVFIQNSDFKDLFEMLYEIK